MGTSDRPRRGSGGEGRGCATPGLPDTFAMRDLHAERMVLCALLTRPAAFARRLAADGFDRDDLFHPSHRTLYDVLTYLANGSPEGPILAECFGELCRRGQWCDCGSWRDMANWLTEIWGTFMWLGADPGKPAHATGMFFWATPPGADDDYVWAGLAAAAKVRHLAARRAATHAALEVLRDAGGSVTDAEGYFDMGSQLGDV